MLDWELSSSDEMSDDEEAEQFDDTQPIAHIDDLQTADTNIKTHSALCYKDDSTVRVLQKVRVHTRQHELAPNWIV